ncbi:MAG: cell division protein FtsZ, partial [Candidatus Diapherotrites archaeon]|nr:cell division protein FtsZ [Candidatus Diapherotrites archaeon]
MVLESIVKEALSKEISVDKYAEEFGVPKIRVMGCGGAGNNTVNRLAKLGVSGAELLAINTDKQHLSIIDESIKKVLIGKSITRGLGAGGYPEMGAKSAEVSRAALEEALADTDMLFLCAGMGGGTG